MSDVLQTILSPRIVPVAVIHDARHADPLADALAAGGLPCMEVTLRTPAALEAIQRTATRQGMVVGAGTVLSVDQARRAVDAGAAFIVAPGLNPELVAHCQDDGVPVVPGVCTPTEIEAALRMGLRLLKFFPAEAMGGTATIKAVGGPYGDVSFLPTGGIGAHNVAEYLRLPKVAACGGSWMASPRLQEAGDWAEVTRLTAEAVELAAANTMRG